MIASKSGRWIRLKITPEVASVADRISSDKAILKDLVYRQALRIGLDAMDDQPFFLKPNRRTNEQAQE